jgi:uncharacterized protein YyaL (SSP411 family)
VVARSLQELAAQQPWAGSDPAALQARLAAAAATLLAMRSARPWPGRDEKVLTSWNALAIRGLADAARALGRTELTQAATRALDFIRRRLWQEGRLLAVSQGPLAHVQAYLDDHVLLIDAILALQNLRFDAEELAFAASLAELVLARFADTERGGFYFTADDHEALIHRSRFFGDDAMPAGNAVAAQVLLRLGYLLGEERYLAAAEATLRAGWSQGVAQPMGHISLLTALEEQLQPPAILVLRGQPATLARWQGQLLRVYAPRVSVLAIAADATNLPPALASKPPRGEITAYLCRGSQCSAPIDSLSALLLELRAL